MTAYEVVPNTDGQILIPVRKKQPVPPQTNIPRTVPPSQRPSGKRIPVRRFGGRPRPRSPPFQRPVYKSKIRTPEALRPGQSQASKYNSNERLEPREFANRRLRAIESSTRYLKDSKTSTLSSHASNQNIIADGSKFLRRKENPLIKSKDNKHANIMSLSYIMDQRPSAQEFPSATEEIEESVIDLTAYSQSEEEYESEDEGREEMAPLIRDIQYSRRIPYLSNSLPHIPNQTNVASLQNSLLNTRMKLEGIEQAVRSFEFVGDKGVSGTVQSRARCKLAIEGRGAAHSQCHPNYTASSPLNLPRSIPRTTASPDISTLEHTAITTLASLNRFFDSKSLYPSATVTSAPNLNSPVSTNESNQTHSPSLKRPSSHISTYIPTGTHQSTLPALLATTELETSTKRIRISSTLELTPPPPAYTSPTPQNQPTGSLCSDTYFTHDLRKLASDLENNNLMPSQSSDAYPSPPKSASLPSSVHLRTSPQPFDPQDTSPSISHSKRFTNLQSNLDSFSDRTYRSPTLSPPSLPEHKVHTPALTETAPRSLVPIITDDRKPNPTPQSQLLFFGHQAYSPLPARSSSIIRSSSPPISSLPSSTSPSSATKSDSKSLPRKHFAYRAWKLRPSRSILTSLSGSNSPQYLVVIRNDDRSKSTPSPGALDKNGNTSKWWSVLAGKEGLDEIRKIFE